LDTILALETYLDEFAGVLLIVSHDRAFASKVTDHLFIFEGDGEVKDFRGSLSEYASALVEIENQSLPGSSLSPSSSPPSSSGYDYDATDEKITAAERREQINKVRQAKKDMDKLDRSGEKLREKAKAVQKELENSSEEGWTKLAELTETLTALNDEIEEKEMLWMELAEFVEQAEVDTV
jgi:ABC transport system ATP-binding/permease protein